MTTHTSVTRANFVAAKSLSMLAATKLVPATPSGQLDVWGSVARHAFRWLGVASTRSVASLGRAVGRDRAAFPMCPIRWG